MFFDVLHRSNIRVIMIAGNHDTAYKNTNEVNSPELMLLEYDNITVLDRPETVTVKDTDICFLPWICADNYSDSLDEIKNTKAEVCMGHLEISGFLMYRGAASHEGMSKEHFSKFSMVFSGHYHHKSDDGHIYYLGNPYELTWQDYNDPRGFHLFDLDTYKLEFIQNPYSLFHRIEYDDTREILDSSSDVADKYVKLVVVNKTDYYRYDQFLNKLYNSNPIEVKIVEDFSEYSEGKVDETINLEDTSSVMNNYVDSLETDVDRERLKTFMKSLYIEAINREVI
jgi:DNA repair exonuclease SbcCD nuclease subunit